MSLVLQKEKVFAALLKDFQYVIYRKSHTEVTEKSDVLVHGIQLVLLGQSPEQANWDSIIERKPIKRSIELEKEKDMASRTMPPQHLILPLKIFHQWVDSLIMDKLKMISY